MKTRELFIVPYCHIDWQWRNTRRYFIHRNRQVIFAAMDLLAADPRHRWAGIHKFHVIDDFWKTYPCFHDTLRQLVRQGRIDLVGSTYVTPLPPHVEDEVIIRNIVEGKRCFRELFGDVEDRVLYLADVPTAYEQMPQIASKAGFDFYVVDRPSEVLRFKKIPTEFLWRGADGSELVVTNTIYASGFPWPGGHHTTVTPGNFEAMVPAFEKHVNELQRWSSRGYLYLPEGGDWAFPTIMLPDFLDYWNEKHPECPARIATHSDYFRRLEQDRDELFELEGNWDIVSWNGMYGINGDHGNRRLRRVANALVSTEKLLALARLEADAPATSLSGTWQELLIGYAHGGYDKTTLMPEDLDAMENMLDRVAERLSRRAQDAAGALLGPGNADVLFNPLEFDRSEWVELGGRWSHASVPALSVAGIAQDAGAAPDACDVQSWAGFERGCSVSLVVERGNVQLLTANYTSREELRPTDERAEPAPVPGGDARRMSYAYEKTEATVTLLRLPGEPYLRLRTHLKTSLENSRFGLQIRVPWAEPTVVADEPFLVRERDPLGEPQVDLVRSRPGGFFESQGETRTEASEGENRGVFYAHTFAALEGPDAAVALLNCGTVGYQFTGDALSNILLSVRPKGSLDQYSCCPHLQPPHEYVFEHRLFFYKPQDRMDAYRQARAFNFPLLPVKGKAWSHGPLVSGLPANIYLSAAYWDDGVVLRFFETEGRAADAELILPSSRELVAEECDLLLRPCGTGAAAVRDGRVRLEFSPYEIKTIRLLPPAERQ